MPQGTRNGTYVTFGHSVGVANGAHSGGAKTNGHALVPEESMDQVRDLLFGAMRRELELRLGHLERRMDAVEHQIKAMNDGHVRDRKVAFDQLSRGVADLAEEIRRIHRMP